MFEIIGISIGVAGALWSSAKISNLFFGHKEIVNRYDNFFNLFFGRILCTYGIHSLGRSRRHSMYNYTRKCKRYGCNREVVF